VKSLASNGWAECVTADGVTLMAHAAERPEIGQRAYVSIRPEKLTLMQPGEDNNLVPCVVKRHIYLGTDTQVLVRLSDGSEVMVRSQNSHGRAVDVHPGAEAAIKLDRDAARLLLG
jgi:spermidine/putrescine transport system ATP-binding protein